MEQDGFADAMRAGIVSLPQDLKAMLRIIEDPELDDAGRLLACGALLHVLSGKNAIPGVKGTLGLVDDVLVLRLTLERIAQTSPEVAESHREDDPETLGPWADHLVASRAFLKERIAVVERALEGLPKISYLGHSALECARDQEAATWLYDSVLEAIVEKFEIGRDEAARAVKNVHEIHARLGERA
jgi:uncharacterized membrane protein YkvA (DUF1232 family)